jgi:hypothetical protein
MHCTCKYVVMNDQSPLPGRSINCQLDRSLEVFGVVMNMSREHVKCSIKLYRLTYLFFLLYSSVYTIVNGTNIPHVAPTTCFDLIGPSSGMF